MRESKLTAKGQTTLPKAVRAALNVKPGDKLRYLLMDGEVRIVKAVPIQNLEGALKRSAMPAVTLDEMEEAIAKGASVSGK